MMDIFLKRERISFPLNLPVSYLPLSFLTPDLWPEMMLGSIPGESQILAPVLKDHLNSGSGKVTSSQHRYKHVMIMFSMMYWSMCTKAWVYPPPPLPSLSIQKLRAKDILIGSHTVKPTEKGIIAELKGCDDRTDENNMESGGKKCTTTV